MRHHITSNAARTFYKTCLINLDNIYIYIYISLFKDAKLKGLEFHAYAFISFKTSLK